MSNFQERPLLRLFGCCLLFLGCGPTAEQGPPILDQNNSSKNSPEEPLPGEVEFLKAKVYFRDEKVLMFEVDYRFKKGKPDKYYLCEITFPGTDVQGVKTMEKWELKGEGKIRDGIVVRVKPEDLKEFELRFSEASSPQQGYKLISNVLKGIVEKTPGD